LKENKALEMITLATRLIAVLMLVDLVGCAGPSFPNLHSDPSKNSAAAYRQDLAECRQDYPEVDSGAHIRSWENCMRMKGWQ
jgi:hypothetical protein